MGNGRNKRGRRRWKKLGVERMRDSPTFPPSLPLSLSLSDTQMAGAPTTRLPCSDQVQHEPIEINLLGSDRTRTSGERFPSGKKGRKIKENYGDSRQTWKFQEVS